MDIDRDPNVILWRAVISNALLDACSENRARRLDLIEARKWLLTDRRDFDLVCQLALLDPDQVRALAKKTIEEHMRAMGELEDEPEFNQC